MQEKHTKLYSDLLQTQKREPLIAETKTFSASAVTQSVDNDDVSKGIEKYQYFAVVIQNE